MTREETRKAIEVMQHFANGGEVEVYYYDGFGDWRDIDDPEWDWRNFEYRIAKPEPVSIPITEAQKSLLLPIIWIRDREENIVGWRKGVGEVSMSDKKEFLFLNPITKCWEEWSEELERELLK